MVAAYSSREVVASYVNRTVTPAADAGLDTRGRRAAAPPSQTEPAGARPFASPAPAGIPRSHAIQDDSACGNSRRATSGSGRCRESPRVNALEPRDSDSNNPANRT